MDQMRKPLHRVCIIVIAVIMMVPMVPTAVFADDEIISQQMNVYGIYLKRNSGSAKSSDRYGDAVLIESNGEYLLMDTGAKYPVKNSDKKHASNLVKTLRAIGVTTLSIYISHVHGDHTGGMEAVLKNFDVGVVYLPDTAIASKYKTPNTHKPISKINEELAALANKYGAYVVYLSPSFRKHEQETISEFYVGAATCKVMGPVGDYTIKQFRPQDGECGTKEGHYLNNYSLTTMITCGDFKYLTAGDVEEQEEANLVKKYGSKLDADLMKTSHHGLRTSSSVKILKKVKPRWSFAEDHGFTPWTGVSYSRYQKYGYHYSVCSKKAGFVVSVTDGAVKLYKDRGSDGISNDNPYKGWVTVKGKYQYYGKKGNAATGWTKIGGKMYYFSPQSGFRFTGTHTINGKKCVFNSTGTLKKPKKPTRVTIQKIAAYKGRVKITWKKAARTSRYQIYRSETQKGGYAKVGTVKNTRQFYNDKTAEKGKTYYYKVRAVRYYAGAALTGRFSKVKSIKAK